MEAPGQEAIRPIRTEARARLLEAIAKARQWVDEIVSGKVTGTDAIARREGLSERSVRMTVNLAFLAPQIIGAAIAGSLPHGTGLSHMCDPPIPWNDQHSCLAEPKPLVFGLYKNLLVGSRTKSGQGSESCRCDPRQF